MADLLQEDSGEAHNFGHKEWDQLEESFINAGYREGITDGKEAALQEGFDQGYALHGVPIGREIGRLRGLASALLVFLKKEKSNVDAWVPPLEHRPGPSDILNEVQLLVQSFQQISLSALLPPDTKAILHAKEHEVGTARGSVDLDQLAADQGQIMETTRQEVNQLRERLCAIITQLGFEETLHV
ncbi:uncharacterized protein EI90DRAFT_2994337 [Cantharellus anzutake]|uniref:uncharacterized protein n=1 Tax=Cantharellus anzutake TaxID=1750568 RepID=UPI0019051C80|nr:uncharacterized protein EI90DRAFT_2994337 [Cantharellus anzutake]KAF8333436.1 hypothetical protein EI90DRAFT_2994337 [Cantharellus anzutake]